MGSTIMSNTITTTDKTFQEQAQSIISLVKTGNEVVTGVNNLISVTHGIEGLIEKAASEFSKHKPRHQGKAFSQDNMFWANSATTARVGRNRRKPYCAE
jgi:hypothetical protein